MRQPKEDVLIILVASSILLSALTASFSAASDTLNTSRPLYDGETLVSNGGAFALGFFSPDSNSSKRYVGIWYHSISSHDVVWVANSRNPVPDLSGSLTLTHNGTLVIVAGNESSKVIIWYSSGQSNGNAAYANQTAQLLDSGNLVVRADYATAGEDDTVAYTWQSFDYPSNTLLPGMAIGWDLRKGLNRNVTSWASMTDPSPGAYTVAINLGDVPQLVEIKGHSLYWRGGPWVSKGFTGLPQISAYNVAMVAFIATREEVSYILKPGNRLLRMKLNPDGTVLRLGWLNPPGQWSLFWKTPKDQCDAYSPCGAFGVCNPDDLPVCSCLRGFRAKKQGRWTLLEVTDGCVRNTALDCRRNGTQSTDGFLLVSGVKLPDTSAAMADGSLGLDDCRKRCLMNCSCTAYSLTDVITGGSGCIMWSGELNDTRMFSQGGQDLYVRVAAADDVNTSNGKGKIKSKVALVMPILGSLIAGFILISCLIIRHHGKRKKRFCKVSRDGNDIDLPLLDLETIAEATNDFSDENKLGEGGFGPVYKGRRKEDGKEIAVKRLSKSSTQGFDEFKNEILLIAKLQHRNLVRLLGCCIQRQERILIYEYMPNKSLDTFLFDKEKKSLLNWPTRYGIIIGIARGLVYLHQDSVIRVVHRDLKASNILLSQEMEPKISDFGLARIFGGDEAAKSQTKTVVGTHGYMSPEYLMDGIFSVKSDVFSFGVLVLEVISNQRNRGFSPFQDKNIVEQAWSLWKEGRALELVDKSMGNSLIIAQVFRCIKVGLLCVQERPDQRPLMSSVILMLTGDNELLPDPEPPGFIARRHSFVADRLSLSNQESELSINLVTLTMPHYR